MSEVKCAMQDRPLNPGMLLAQDYVEGPSSQEMKLLLVQSMLQETES